MSGNVHYGGAVIALALVGILAGLGVLADAKGAVPTVTGNPTVDALLGQMTLDEKLSMVTGGPEDWSTNEFEVGYQPGVPRLADSVGALRRRSVRASPRDVSRRG